MMTTSVKPALLFPAILLLSLTSVIAQFKEPHCLPGRSVMAQLFQWRWDDVADECERFLGPYGYCGVQISPPNENVVMTSPERPWWERYQPVSYKLVTRSGNSSALQDMIDRCNKANVRVYVNIVINHMTGGGSGSGTGGSTYDRGAFSYPAVPYGRRDFNDGSHCHTPDGEIHDYQNAEEVRNCNLMGMADLALGNDYVRGKVADFLNGLIDMGVAGFRVDAAKHMWPADMKNIFLRLKNLRTDLFGASQEPFIFQEVIDEGNEPIKGDEYLQTGRITNFKFGLELGKVFRHQNAMKYLSNFGVGWGMWSGNDVVNFLDNHDNQRTHAGDGGVLTYKEPRPYKLATAFMLAHPYGLTRVMSSYDFSLYDQGPPNTGGDINRVALNADMSCGGGWVCEHRWRQIYNMVAFRNKAGLEPVANWWTGADYQIAFSRGDKAFVAFNLESSPLSATLQTGLPPGEYCDVISGNLVQGQCSGRSVVVRGDGMASISVCSDCEDPMLAIHVGAKVGAAPSRV